MTRNGLEIPRPRKPLLTGGPIRKKEDPWNGIIAGFFTGTPHLLFLGFRSHNPSLHSFSIRPQLCSNRNLLTSTTGGSLAIRSGARAVRNGAIGCAILIAVIEGVGIGFQRMMVENTRLDLPPPPPAQPQLPPSTERALV